jgi:hypothetical protein
MTVTHAQMVDLLRGIHARAGGTGAILNLIRGSEVRGAADLAVLTDLVTDPQRKMDLARHAFDEARHGYLLLRRMNELGFQAFRLPPELDRVEGLIARSRVRDVKDVYTDRGSVSEAALLEFTMAVYIPENDAVTKLRGNYDALTHDVRSQAVIAGILRDEARHVAYLASWLERFERRFSHRAVSATRERLEEVFRQLDVVYYGAMQEYFDRAAAA